MNNLLALGLLLVIGYILGWLFEKINLPKIIGYIITGILFSPTTFSITDVSIIDTTHSLMEICLAFIAFEVGGELSFAKLKAHEKEILSITFFETLFPLILVGTGIFLLITFFIDIALISQTNAIVISILLAALSCPTAPAATIAVMKQYKAKGKVSETIIGIVALDDTIGIIYFTFGMAIISFIVGNADLSVVDVIYSLIYKLVVALSIGAILALMLKWLSNLLNINTEGKWIVLIFALIILNVGVAIYFEIDAILSSMIMGMVTINRSKKSKSIFKILERYTEDLIFLFFFLLSGIHLNILSIPKALPLILVYVVLRAIGKYIGVHTGAKLAGSESNI